MKVRRKLDAIIESNANMCYAVATRTTLARKEAELFFSRLHVVVPARAKNTLLVSALLESGDHCRRTRLCP
jgi:hypothetical protein